jgi:hypothetical protein
MMKAYNPVNPAAPTPEELRLFWVTSARNPLLKCRGIKLSTLEHKSLVLSDSATEAKNKYGASSILIFDNHVIFGGNVELASSSNLMDPIITHMDSDFNLVESFIAQGVSKPSSVDYLTFNPQFRNQVIGYAARRALIGPFD